MSNELRNENEPGSTQTRSVAACTANKDELEREQRQLANEKLKIEIRKLANDTAPEKWWSKLAKNVVAVGGILTVAATGYGLFDGYSKTLNDRERTRSTELRMQFEEAIKKLESKSAISKLVAVSVLSGYLTESYRSFHRQILFTFASVVATESDLQTQAAILDLMNAQDAKAIAADDWTYFQIMLVSQSRALVARRDLYRKRQFGLDTIIPTDDEVAARHVGNLIAVNIRRGVVPAFGAYAGIYCEACDLRYKRFPDGADFTGAILDRADFRGATLRRAVFDNAEMEGTVFAQAYLKDASFQTVAANRLMGGVGATAADVARIELSTPYLQHVLAELESQMGINMTMPDFSCANLQGARFDNLSLFGIAGHEPRKVASGDESKEGWRANLSERHKRKLAEGGTVELLPLTATPPSFYKADLSGARLEGIRAFLLRLKSETTPAQYFKSTIMSDRNDLILWEGPIRKTFISPPPLAANATPNPEPEIRSTDRGRLLAALKIAFLEANLSGANLPEGVMDVLATTDAPKREDPRLLEHQKWQFLGYYPISGNWDWSCPTTTSPLQ